VVSREVAAPVFSCSVPWDSGEILVQILSHSPKLQALSCCKLDKNAAGLPKRWTSGGTSGPCTRGSPSACEHVARRTRNPVGPSPENLGQSGPTRCSVEEQKKHCSVVISCACTHSESRSSPSRMLMRPSGMEQRQQNRFQATLVGWDPSASVELLGQQNRYSPLMGLCWESSSSVKRPIQKCPLACHLQ
jgi:hypothetical protein